MQLFYKRLTPKSKIEEKTHTVYSNLKRKQRWGWVDENCGLNNDSNVNFYQLALRVYSASFSKKMNSEKYHSSKFSKISTQSSSINTDI